MCACVLCCVHALERAAPDVWPARVYAYVWPGEQRRSPPTAATTTTTAAAAAPAAPVHAMQFSGRERGGILHQFK